MTQSKEHTPLPWKYEYGNWSQKYCIKISLDGRRVPIADVHEEANAKLIIEAVNNHDRLLRENKRMREALEKIRKYSDRDGVATWAHEALESPLDK